MRLNTIVLRSKIYQSVWEYTWNLHVKVCLRKCLRCKFKPSGSLRIVIVILSGNFRRISSIYNTVDVKIKNITDFLLISSTTAACNGCMNTALTEFLRGYDYQSILELKIATEGVQEVKKVYKQANFQTSAIR